MKKICSLFIMLMVLSVVNVQAKDINDETFEDLGSKLKYKDEASNEVKFYYQWSKLTKEQQKEKEEIKEEIDKIEQEMKNISSKLEEIDSLENKITSLTQDIQTLNESRTELETEIQKQITEKENELSQQQKKYGQDKSCFSNSSCTSLTFTSLEQIEQYYASEFQKLEDDIQTLNDQKNTELGKIEAQIVEKQKLIDEYNAKISEKDSLMQKQTELVKESNILDKTYYDLDNLVVDDNWIEMTDLTIEKPDAKNEAYALVIKGIYKDGESYISSYYFMNLSKVTKEEKVSNPKTIDKGLVYVGGLVLTIGTMITIKKKLKTINI